jgi:hypothetical protein
MTVLQENLFSLEFLEGFGHIDCYFGTIGDLSMEFLFGIGGRADFIVHFLFEGTYLWWT